MNNFQLFKHYVYMQNVNGETNTKFITNQNVLINTVMCLMRGESVSKKCSYVCGPLWIFTKTGRGGRQQLGSYFSNNFWIETISFHALPGMKNILACFDGTQTMRKEAIAWFVDFSKMPRQRCAVICRSLNFKSQLETCFVQMIFNVLRAICYFQRNKSFKYLWETLVTKAIIFEKTFFSHISCFPQ